MARMLDILESFLSYHGHTYLRLDGATQIEHRQILMERFNQDRRIFCFILSTRSGGIGINLTGADTVIFYDSDWNPTMDAQAQDRCHRIGQTRDVHIYRLISEKTVEENILKKSMQKRKLGEIAIEEGEFTSEFFKKSNIADIFELVNADTSKLPSLSQQELEQVMTRVEDDERDVAAANVARAEAVANMDEFNEESPQPSTSLNADDDASTIDPDMLKIDQEMKHLMEQLKPVERYAVRYIEAIVEPDRLDEVRQTEREIESHKRKWEQLQETSAVENERKRRRIRDEEFDLTYEIDDSTSQVNTNKDASSSTPLTHNSLAMNRKRRSTFGKRRPIEPSLSSVFENSSIRVNDSLSYKKDVIEDSKIPTKANFDNIFDKIGGPITNISPLKASSNQLTPCRDTECVENPAEKTNGHMSC
uniref:Helicase C-terminal domain-containing protein n=1 Tax=Romanomermis culicivorax TaxID=13658 RepID=A0A915KVD8_ROMCU